MTAPNETSIAPLATESLLEYRVRRGWRRACHLAVATTPRLDPALLSRMENGRRSPHGEELLARFFGITHSEMELLVLNGRRLR